MPTYVQYAKMSLLVMIDNLNKEASLQNIITAKKGRRDFTQQHIEADRNV
jgi:hypothetical protein